MDGASGRTWGRDSRDKSGTAPQGVEATLGIHKPHQGRPSPFILTRVSVLVSVLASTGS